MVPATHTDGVRILHPILNVQPPRNNSHSHPHPTQTAPGPWQSDDLSLKPPPSGQKLLRLLLPKMPNHDADVQNKGLGNHLLGLIQQSQVEPHLAATITGMVLEFWEEAEILAVFGSQSALQAMIEEAMDVLNSENGNVINSVSNEDHNNRTHTIGGKSQETDDGHTVASNLLSTVCICCCLIAAPISSSKIIRHDTRLSSGGVIKATPSHSLSRHGFAPAPPRSLHDHLTTRPSRVHLVCGYCPHKRN